MASNYVFLKSAAENPVIPFEFSDGEGNPINLTGKSVSFTMRPWNSANYIVSDQPAIVDVAIGGSGHYALSSDEAVVGHHLGEWTVNPGALRLPVDGYIHVLISPSL